MNLVKIYLPMCYFQLNPVKHSSCEWSLKMESALTDIKLGKKHDWIDAIFLRKYHGFLTKWYSIGYKYNTFDRLFFFFCYFWRCVIRQSDPPVFKNIQFRKSFVLFLCCCWVFVVPLIRYFLGDPFVVVFCVFFCKLFFTPLYWFLNIVSDT
jgi:hypothetical protein